MSKIKVMIVDDHPVVREGLKQLLEISDIEVVAVARSGFECLNLLGNTDPDIVFMDVRMPGISGIETTRLLCERHPNVKVIMLTIYPDDQYVKEAILAGAKGYVLKKVTREDLVRLIHHVMEDGAFLDPAVTGAVLSEIKKESVDIEPPEKAALTQRELEVLSQLVSGLKDRDIAEALTISEHTVKTHIKSIYRKLKVSTRAQAVVKAGQQGIIEGEGYR